jgi:N,N-dimethylformamidase
MTFKQFCRGLLNYPLNVIRYCTNRSVPLFQTVSLEEMAPRTIEGYSDKLAYFPGETISFYLHSPYPSNRLSIRRITGAQSYETILEREWAGKPQQGNPFTERSRQGCGWEVSLQVHIDAGFTTGYYECLLAGPETGSGSSVQFLVGDNDFSGKKILIVAPCTTWVAYNNYGGRSFYQNNQGDGLPCFLSTRRPNHQRRMSTAFERFDLLIEAGIFNWFDRTWPGQVALIADYSLEQAPWAGGPRTGSRSAPGESGTGGITTVVLSYHCEYFSSLMYKTLRRLVLREGKHLIGLGANQVYWKVRWNKEHTVLECRKDYSWFKGTLSQGKLWRHSFFPEEALLGVCYSMKGEGSYAPYMLRQPGHPLWGLPVPGPTFGNAGMAGLPVCGDETDKPVYGFVKDLEVLAIGMNCGNTVHGAIYPDTAYEWDASGGGYITYYQRDGRGVLSLGSIHAGAALSETGDGAIGRLLKAFIVRHAL